MKKNNRYEGRQVWNGDGTITVWSRIISLAVTADMIKSEQQCNLGTHITNIYSPVVKTPMATRKLRLFKSNLWTTRIYLFGRML